MPRRRLLGFVLAAGVLAGVAASSAGFAQTPAVPPDLQATLIVKLLPYDRNFAARAGSRVRVVVLVKRGSARSRLSAEAFKSALSGLGNIGGLPQEVRILVYENAAALVNLCRSEHVAVVYVTPDFDDDVATLQRAFDGVDVLSVAAVPEYVPRGLVLGFELLSGKPKILLNLQQARLENVNFGADVLRLMRVYR